MRTLTEPALIAWGERIGRQARPPLVIALRGDLGAGKSTFARAIARGAGVKGAIPSPTYNLLLRYPADRAMHVVHIDLYRLEDEDEIWALGWSEVPGPDELVLVEWPERAEALLPTPRWEVELGESDDPNVREIRARKIGADAQPIPDPPSGG